MLNTSRRTFLGTAGATLGAIGATTAGILLDPADAYAAAIPNRSGLAWRSGCATDDINPAGFERFRGRPVDLRTAFWRRATWAGMERLDGLTGKLKPFGSGPRETTLITYYLFPDQENPKRGGRGVWQAAARGEFDVHHRKIAAALARYQGPYIFRIGHEWNGDEFSWGVTDPSLAPYYKDYFKRTADILRRANPGSLVDWCCLKRGSARVSIQNFYPGGSWVDFIGHDRYDRYPTFRNEQDWTSKYNETLYGGPVGLGAWVKYARSEGKKLSIAEWAVAKPSQGGSADNPFYISKMLKFFRANAGDMGFECYFNREAGQGGHRLEDNPKAGAMYKQLMRTGGV
jgi:Glycosyl hydrolase family 26